MDALVTTDMSIAMNDGAINREWKDMFMDGPLTSIPPLRPDKFNFPSTEVSENELDDIRERQEYAL